MVIPEARKRGVQNIIVTHVNPINVTVPQMQQMARDGAKIEFCYASMRSAPSAPRTSSSAPIWAARPALFPAPCRHRACWIS
jgi:hypothetical protein